MLADSVADDQPYTGTTICSATVTPLGPQHGALLSNGAAILEVRRQAGSESVQSTLREHKHRAKP